MKKDLGKYIESQEKKSARLSRLNASISWWRVLVFLAAAYTGYLFFAVNTAWLYAFVVLLIGFVTLVVWQVKIRSELEFEDKLLFVLRNEADIQQGKPSAYFAGNTELDNELALDLDLLGPGSLFHHINRTGTAGGRILLRDTILHPPMHKESIIRNQDAIRKLMLDPDFCYTFQANALLTNEDIEQTGRLHNWGLSRNQWIGTRQISLLKFIAPTLFAAGVLLSATGIWNMAWGYAFIFNLMVTGYFARKTQQVHQALSKGWNTIRRYGILFQAIAGKDFTGNIILSEISEVSEDAASKLKKLSRIGEFFDQRMNLIVNVLLNGIFLYDLHLVSMLENWKKLHYDNLNEWLKRIYRLDVLVSFTGFARQHPNFTFPEPVTDFCFEAKGLGHPLIDEHKRVVNDFSFVQKPMVVLLTGSNMAGKSTFLRTLGINLLMAECGLPVCATYFRFSPLTLHTSLRLSDSLLSDESYFYAELKRIRHIMEEIRYGEALVLLDEVLRGTNSDDKRDGTYKLIKRMLQYQSVCMIATHDTELARTELEFPTQVHNYCFESTIEDDSLKFDYTLKRGYATNRNAVFLMRKMGIIGD